MSPLVATRAAASARGYGWGLFTPASPSDFEHIETITVGAGGAASVTFSGIPQTYKHLQIRFIARGTGSDAGGQIIFGRFNGDTGSNYTTHRLSGDGSAASSTATTSDNKLNLWRQTTAAQTASVFGVGVVDLLDYTSTSKNKTIRQLGGFDNNGSGLLGLVSTAWMSTAAVTSLLLYPETSNFAQYTEFRLYGWK